MSHQMYTIMIQCVRKKVDNNPLKTKHICFIYKDPVRTAQQALFFSVIKTNLLILYRKVIAVCSQIRTKHINAT
jgi:hypothetical protein